MSLAAGLSAAAQVTAIKEVPTRTPISAKDKTGLPTIEFKKYVSTIDVGEIVGQTDSNQLFHTDNWPYRWNERVNTAVGQFFEKHVNKTLAAFGYPIPKKRDAIFDTETKPEEPPLELGVLVRSAKVHFVVKGAKAEGQVYLDAKWALFNPKTQKILLELPVEASFQTGSNAMDWDDIYVECVINLTRNLMSSPAFMAALSGSPDAAAATPASFAFSFPSIAPPKGGTAKNGTMLSAAVVTIESSGGTGSGFYISRDGYLLTDRHVVGEAKFVKIRTATGRELPGEVVSVNVARDVALIKTQKIPFDPLSLRLTDPAPGDEVYAIGSPLGDEFSGSITHGVVSGLRDADHTRYLQSDVSVLPGNSGGPLLDASGAVIGLTQGGMRSKGGNMNFFIPIADALSTLSIEIKQTGAETPVAAKAK